MLAPLRSLLPAAAACAVLALPAAGTMVAVSGPPPLVIDADPGHPVLAGGLAAAAALPAERFELLAITRPRPSAEANRRATAELVAALRAALPGTAVTGEPAAATMPAGLVAVDAVVAGGSARAELPGPLDEGRLRELVERARAALPAGASIADVAPGFASCAAFERSGDDDARAAAAELARAFGRPPGEVRLRDRTMRPVHGGRPDPLCGPAAHARLFPLQRSLVPTTAIAREARVYAFAEPLPAGPRTVPAGDLVVPASGTVPAGAGADARVRVAGGLSLTVDGFARVRVPFAGARYVWSGPNGTYRAGELPADPLGDARRRLRALGIADDDVVAQHDPVGGQPYVAVRSRDASPREAVVDAIAGPRPAERHEVRFLRYRAACAPRADDLRAAVADAAARAGAVARRLGGAADLAHPLAVDLLTSAPGNACITAQTPPYDDRIVRRLGGALATDDERATVAVTVTFPLRALARDGAALALDAPGPAASAAPFEDAVVRFTLVAPPVEHPAATAAGEARADATLAPTHVLVRSRFGSDSEHAFRNVDPAVASAFAARIGASEADSATSRAAVQGAADDGSPQDELRQTALLPARDGLFESVGAANREANRAGNVWTDVAPERASCGDAPLALAVRAIRAAAADARAHGARGRVVAIDLTGPFALSGACELDPAAPAQDVRRANRSVRLGAYARVSYAR